MTEKLVAVVKWEDDYRDGEGAIVIRIDGEVSTAYHERDGWIAASFFVELKKLANWGYKIEFK